MLLTSEDLLKIINSDCTPEELGALLDRLDRCPQSAKALEVLVMLKANHEEVAAAIVDAEQFVEARGDGWQPWPMIGLRLALSIAVAGTLIVWFLSML